MIHVHVLISRLVCQITKTFHFSMVSETQDDISVALFDFNSIKSKNG